MAFDGTWPTTLGQGEHGCAYLDHANDACGAATKQGSSYCAHHHALCHLARGGAEETYVIRAFEKLKSIWIVVDLSAPSDAEMRLLERQLWR